MGEKMEVVRGKRFEHRENKRIRRNVSKSC